MRTLSAGLQHIAPLHELSLDAWRKMFAVHVDGAFLCTRAALQHMYKRSGTSAATSTDPNRGGCILFMGSVHSKTVSVLKVSRLATCMHVILILQKIYIAIAIASNFPHACRSHIPDG